MLINAFINLIYNSDLCYVVTSPRTQKNIDFLTIGMAPFVQKYRKSDKELI